MIDAIVREADKGGAAGAGAGAGMAAAPGAGAVAVVDDARQKNLAQAAAAAGGAGGGDGAAKPAGADADAAGGKPAAPAAYHPDGLAETYRGATDKETIDRLAADIAARPKPPAAPTDYKFEATGPLAGLVNVANDPVLPIWGAVAHELGLNQQQAQGAFEKLFTKMSAAGLIEKPVDLDTEFKALSDGKGDPVAQIAAGKRVAVELSDEVRSLVTRGVLTADDANVFGRPVSAVEIRAFRKVLSLLPKAGGNVQPGGQQGEAQQTPEQQTQVALDTMYPSMKKAG